MRAKQRQGSDMLVVGRPDKAGEVSPSPAICTKEEGPIVCIGCWRRAVLGVNCFA
jgi:hypothetical protein